MRHGIAGYKLCRDAEDRRALRRNLAIALFTHGQIQTTKPKAKSVQPFVERLISAARKGDLASRRRVIALLGHDQIVVKDDTDESVDRNKYGELVGGQKVVKKLFDDIAPQYASKPGGYTRIIKLARHRIGDGSDLVVLQLIPANETGPQVGGQFSRRRDKANHRMEVAAKLRRSKAQDTKQDAKAEPAAATATEEAPKAE